MLTGRKLALTLAFTVLVALAFGVSCKGFFVKPTLSSIAVGPATPTIETGSTNNTVQMFVVGTYNDGSTGTPAVSWTSGTQAVATISAGGLVTSVSTGTSQISASATVNPSITNSQTVTVTVGCIQSIAISPTSGNLNGAGTTKTFTATATTCNGSVDITDIALWSSSNTAVATATSGGVVTAVADGTVTISASSGGVNSSTNASVTVTGAP